MNCQECKARMYPENPSVPFYNGQGRYLRPLCESCCNYTVPEPCTAPQHEPEWNRRQWDTVQQLTARVQHAEARLNEHVDAARKRASELTQRKEAEKAKNVKGGVAL